LIFYQGAIFYLFFIKKYDIIFIERNKKGVNKMTKESLVDLFSRVANIHTTAGHIDWDGVVEHLTRLGVIKPDERIGEINGIEF
jgi:hypothetical protein